MILEALILGGSAILSTKNINDSKAGLNPANQLLEAKHEVIQAITKMMERVNSSLFSFIDDEEGDRYIKTLYKMRQQIRISDTEKEIFIVYNSLEDMTLELNSQLIAYQTVQKMVEEAKAVAMRTDAEQKEIDRKQRRLEKQNEGSTRFELSDYHHHTVYEVTTYDGDSIAGEYISRQFIEGEGFFDPNPGWRLKFREEKTETEHEILYSQIDLVRGIRVLK